MSVRDLAKLLQAATTASVRQTQPNSSFTLHHCEALVRLHKLAPFAYWLGYKEFHDDFVTAALYAEMRDQLLQEAIEALRSKGIGVVLLKGVSYIGSIYADPALRPMTDIDLLVPRQRYSAALEAIVTLGYKARKGHNRGARHHAITLSRQESTIDLHRSITQPWRNELNIDAMWSRAILAQERHDGALRLDPVDEALIHLAHMIRHEFRVPLITYIDSARLLERLDEEQLASLQKTAERSRLRRAMKTALMITAAFCEGKDLPCTMFNRLMPTFAELAEYERVPRALQILRKLVLLEGPREVLGLLGVEAISRWTRYRARFS